MENLSRSFSKRSYGGNGFGTPASHKSVYDDVFGGPPKFGMPTLAPRFEDYGEIFRGFHSSRSSSVPVLDLPVVDEAELCFDARSSRFDYSEVFGAFDGLDFALSFGDFARESDGRDYSSDDDAWSPAESEFPSGYIDPSAFADRSESLINEDTYHQTCGSEQFETPYNKTEPRRNKKKSNLATHEAQLHAIPGNTYNFEENHSSQKGRVSTVRNDSDLKSNMGFDGGPSEEQTERTTFLPAKFGLRRQVSDCSPVEKYSGPAFGKNKPFVTVNDINLRTKPSQLPPPSRSPPVYTSKEGASVKLKLRQKSARSSFEEAEGNTSPPFYDVEVDGSSSMLASATMGDDMEKAQVNIISAKESIEKKVALQSCSILQPQTYLKTVEENVNKTFESISSYKDDGKVKCAKEGSGTVPFAGERRKVFKDQYVSDFVEKERYNDFAERSTKGRDGRESGLPSQISQKSAEAFAWRQETEYFEVFEAGMPLEAIELHKDDIELVQKDSDKFRNWVVNEAFEQKEKVMDFKSAKVAPKLDQRKNKLEVATDACGDRMRLGTVFEAGMPLEAIELHKDDIELVQKDSDKFRNWVVNEAFEQKEKVMDFKSAKVSPKLDQRKNKLEVATDACGDRMRLGTVSDSSYHIVFQKIAEVDLNSCESDMNKVKIKMPNEHEEIKRPQKDSETGMHVLEGNHNPRGICEKTGSCKMLGDVFARKLRGKLDIEGCDARHGEDIEREKNKKREIIVDERKKQEEYPEKEKNKKRHKEVCEKKENENMPKEVFEFEGDEKRPTESNEHQKNPKKSFEQQENKKNQELDSSGLAFVEVDIAESSTTTSGSRNRTPFEAFGHQELNGPLKDAEQIKRDVKSRTEKVDQVTHLTMERKSIRAFDGTDKLNNESYRGLLSGEFDKSFGKLRGEDEDLKSKFKETEHGIDGRVANCLVEEIPHSVNQNAFQHGKCENGTVDSMNSSCVEQGDSVSNEADIAIGNSSVRLDKEVTERPFEADHTKVTANESGLRVKKTNGGQCTFSNEISKDNLTSHQPWVELSENGNATDVALSAVLGDKETQLDSSKKCIQNVEGKEKSLNETLAQENNKIEERLQKEREFEMENLSKLEEEREREREREKDRMAVNRVALETRDRLYVEAHKRAAVERATAEAQQKAVAEAREKLERLSMEARERSLADKTSVEARHKAEYAAVGRTTLEARQRAFEKAMADRVSSEGRARVERSVSDKFISSRTDELSQSSSFSNSGTLNPLRYSFSSVHVENESESPQRCKARLERYRRTAERAAKALEEKNLRDLVAQREQAERNRLAETLDAEVKRWSSGKETNLRALLSTLQYILGPENGWQPIPLTEVITSAAVKKAYRKAALCVHPDKLQQRGASIQQKYICEKVFDLLKEAWSTFNSEER